MNKHERDNRANQLNPNNKAYWLSRQGEKPKSTKTSYEDLKSVGNAARYTPEFVSAPPKKRLFRRNEDGEYGWVICDHVGKFLISTLDLRWSTEFEKAIVFDNVNDAQEKVKWFKEVLTGQTFFRIRCVKIV